jgi:hypothetical protein
MFLTRNFVHPSVLSEVEGEVMEADNRRVKAECGAITGFKIWGNPLMYFLLIHQVDQLQNGENYENLSTVDYR